MGAIASQFTAKHQQEHKILLVGLVGSGKTTMLHSLQAGEVRYLVTALTIELWTSQKRQLRFPVLESLSSTLDSVYPPLTLDSFGYLCCFVSFLSLSLSLSVFVWLCLH